jgi:hypothetical protein
MYNQFVIKIKYFPQDLSVGRHNGRSTANLATFSIHTPRIDQQKGRMLLSNIRP